jgi:nitrite reductase/ring-hydroxylating ferredoxin subunit
MTLPSIPSPPARIRLCAADEVAGGGTLKVEHGDLVLAVYNVDGEFFVTDDACTHGPGSLSEGELYGDVIECNFHGGQFNVRTGEVAGPPCMEPVKTYKVSVEDGDIFIEV